MILYSAGTSSAVPSAPVQSFYCHHWLVTCSQRGSPFFVLLHWLATLSHIIISLLFVSLHWLVPALSTHLTRVHSYKKLALFIRHTHVGRSESKIYQSCSHLLNGFLLPGVCSYLAWHMVIFKRTLGIFHQK